MTVYRKGITVFYEHVSLYDYDFPKLDINEAREASDWNCAYAIVRFWKNNASVAMINALINDTNSYEFRGMDWDYSGSYLCKAWLEALSGKTIVPAEMSGNFVDDIGGADSVILPHKLCGMLHDTFGDKLTIRGFTGSKDGILPLEKTEREVKVIDESVSFLKKAGIEDVDSFPIVVAQLEKRTLGQAKEGNIYLSRGLFTYGKRKVVEVLLEEYIHARHQAGDRTREYQDILMNLAIGGLESKAGEYL